MRPFPGPALAFRIVLCRASDVEINKDYGLKISVYFRSNKKGLFGKAKRNNLIIGSIVFMVRVDRKLFSFLFSYS